MNKKQKKPSALHPKNLHRDGYDIDTLCSELPSLLPFVFTNKYGTKTIDFADPVALKLLNTALLKKHYAIEHWDFSDNHLCPPIPGRADYIHVVADLLEQGSLKSCCVLDIGTGASCIYPLLGHAIYKWDFVATDVDKASLDQAKTIVKLNALSDDIKCRHQKNAEHIFKGILQETDAFNAVMCNPPFFRDVKEANAATQRKLKGLGKSADFQRNFSGTVNELVYKGGEKAFIHTFLYESSQFKHRCLWYTTLVSNKDLLKGIYASLEKLGAGEIKTIPLVQGNKQSRVVAWTFLTSEERKMWPD